MRLRVNGEYLDFNDDIEIDRQSKLFEELSETKGDVGYQFELPATQNNFKKLGLPFPDVSSKTIYQNVPCDVIDEDGIAIYKGQLRVERIRKRKIETSFFSGNYNWISEIDGNLSDLDLSEHDHIVNQSQIQLVNANKTGLTFPLIDAGALVERSHNSTVVEEYVGAIYVKTVFDKIFSTSGLTYTGELDTDFAFNHLVVCKSNKNKTAIDAASSFANKTSSQTISDGAGTLKITFTDDSTFPYFDGSLNNYSTSLSRYTADVKMRVKVEITVNYTLTGALSDAVFNIYKSGSVFATYRNVNSISKEILLDAGQYVEFFGTYFADPDTGDLIIHSGSTFKITPIYIYQVKGAALVPNWTKREFVKNVLNLFNVISDYNPVSKQVTFNFFNNIKTKEPIDISNYVSEIETDYEEFISGFGKKNFLKYSDSNTEDIRQYNVSETLKYGSGSIDVANDFIEDEVDLIESDFSSPVSYRHPAFDMSLERVDLVQKDDNFEAAVTSVTNSAGVARFNTTSGGLFSTGDLVRVECDNETYDGEWVVNNQAAGYIELRGVSFDTNETGTITKIDINHSDSDNVYIFLNLCNTFVPVSDISSLSQVWIGTTFMSNTAYAWFNLLNIGKGINTKMKQGLSFGEINDPLFYQKTLTETYWRNTESVLNDPVKLICTAHLPKSVFMSLSPLTPVRVKTKETNNIYYLNLIRGYKAKSKPCIVELIKL